jgi:hypothetical protein
MNGWDGYLRVSHLYSSEAKFLRILTWQAIIEAQGKWFRKQDTLNFQQVLKKIIYQ